MINWEHRLIAKIIETGDIKTVLTERISLDVLHTTQAQAIFSEILDVYQSKGSVPTEDMLHEHFPKFRFPTEVKDGLAVICQHIREKHLAQKLKQLSTEISEMVDDEPDATLARVSAEVSNLSQSTRVTEDIIISTDVEKVKADYLRNKQLRKSGKALGIEYPWEALTRESMGMLDGELIFFYGRPKNLKTFVTCYIAAYAYAIRNKRVLFFTKEMSPRQIQDRILCCLAEVDYGVYRKGEMEPTLEKEFFGKLEGLRGDEKQSVIRDGQRREKTFVISADNREDGGGIASLHGMIEQYEPDIVFVDGMYHMKDDKQGTTSRDWKNIANLTTGLKKTAQRYKIPVVANTQANRAGETRKKGTGVSDMAFSDAAGQDADLAIRIIKDRDKRGEKILKLIIGGSREFDLEGLIIGGTPCTDFRFRKLITDQAEQEDPEEETRENIAAIRQNKLLSRGKVAAGTSAVASGLSDLGYRKRVSFDPRIG